MRNECNNKIIPITFSASVELESTNKLPFFICIFNFFKCGFKKWTRFQTRMTTTQSVTPELIRDEEQKEKKKRRPTGKMNFYAPLCFVPLLLLNYAKHLFLTDITFNKNHRPVAVCHQLMIWTAHFEWSALQPLIHTHTQIHSCTHTLRAGRDMKDRCRYFVRIWHSIFLYMRLYFCKLICFI